MIKQGVEPVEMKAGSSNQKEKAGLLLSKARSLVVVSSVTGQKVYV
jgi:hypothetical protein